MKNKIAKLLVLMAAGTAIAACASKPATNINSLRMPPGDMLTVDRVVFKNRIHIDIAGDLYMRKDIDRSQRHMAIVVGHPFGGVKEQT
jgi:uncharacterized lipoprotein YajG